MGLISKEVEISLTSRVLKWYENKGYKIPRVKNNSYKFVVPKGTNMWVKVEDLPNGSRALVEVKCDCKDCKNPYLKPITWENYKRNLREDGKYYCQKCGTNLFGRKKALKTRLEKSISFEQWCIDNNRQDILDRWDYKLNDKLPSEVSYGTSRYWFKCDRNSQHKSELKNVYSFTSGEEGTMLCNQCNSFAQWGIDNISEDFLDKYWDWDKNNELGINPWEISKRSNISKVWIICQEKDYHGSYKVICSNFAKENGTRCPYCNTWASGKVHPLESLGQLLEDKNLLYLWSDKNKKSPYEYAPMSNKKAWWKCPEGKHEDFKRKISDANGKCRFRCSECQSFKGEIRIKEYLANNNIEFIPQKEFDGLLGLKNGNLSYDFYLPQYNFLIEYQGEYHDGNGGEYIKRKLKRQQEHDRRKREYAKNNKIDLLEIWYWDYDNIEKILEEFI